MTTPSDNIDQRLTQLVAATEGLLQVTQEQRQEQRERFDQLLHVTREQGENITRLTAQQREQFEQEMVALRELRQITEKQAETARSQTENVKSLTAEVASLSRSVDTLARNNKTNILGDLS